MTKKVKFSSLQELPLYVYQNKVTDSQLCYKMPMNLRQVLDMNKNERESCIFTTHKEFSGKGRIENIDGSDLSIKQSFMFFQVRLLRLSSSYEDACGDNSSESPDIKSRRHRTKEIGLRYTVDNSFMLQVRDVSMQVIN